MIKIIKFAIRPNLIYPLQCLIYSILRDIELKLVEKFQVQWIITIYTFNVHR